MKKLLLVIAITASVITKAQITGVSLQASGLTCSMCSNAINKALKTLDFVLKVEADIKTYTFEISFKPNSRIDFDMIRKKVTGAGFSVAAFFANINFDNVRIKDSQPVIIQDKTLHFVNANEQVLNGVRKVKIIDKGFIAPKEFNRSSFEILPALSYHVTF